MGVTSHDASPGQPWSGKALTTSIKVLIWVGLRPCLGISIQAIIWILLTVNGERGISSVELLLVYGRQC